MSTRALNAQPWRFKPGDLVFVRGWPADETAMVTAQIETGVFPEYLVVDSVGAEWHVAQIKLSSRTIAQEALLPLFAHAAL